MNRYTLKALLLILCVLFTAGCQAESTERPATPRLILRYAENQPEDYPTTQAACAFADMVQERTGGDVQIVIFPDGALGSEKSVIEQMIYGGIDLSRVSLSQLSEYQPGLNMLQLPFLYENSDQMWQVLDSALGNEFLDSLSVIHLTGLSWYDAGVRSFYSRKKTDDMDGLSGLRIRVQESAFMSEMITLLGGVPVPLVYSQVYMALRTDEIDAAENNWPSYAAQKHYEVAPYVLRDEHSRIPEIQLISEAALAELEALNPDYPDIIRECARESSRIERKLWAEEESRAEQAMTAAGVTVTEVSEEEHNKFRNAVLPLYEKYLDLPVMNQIRNR